MIWSTAWPDIVATHSLRLSGDRFRIRPVDLADAARILALRTDAKLARYLNPTSPSLAEQERWIEQYLERDGDFYFVVEDASNGVFEGAIALYHCDRDSRQAEMGRWILRRGSLAAAQSALLVYQLAFDEVCLDRVYCQTVADNRSVVSFHRSCGLRESGRDLRVVLADGEHQVVEQYVDRSNWAHVAATLRRAAASADRLLDRASADRLVDRVFADRLVDR